MTDVGTADLRLRSPRARHELEARGFAMGSTRNTEDRNDGHDRHGELDLGFEFVRLGPRARPSSPPSSFKLDHIMPPGPGDGWGFPNDNPDNYGWVDYEDNLPLGADRTAEYYFPRFFAVPPEQMFTQTYYNPFETRGQRYIPYVGAGGDHPAGGPPLASAALPVSPYADEPNTSRGSGPSFERQSRGGAASFGRFGFNSLTRDRQ